MKTLEMYHIIFPFTRHLALITKGESRVESIALFSNWHSHLLI